MAKQTKKSDDAPKKEAYKDLALDVKFEEVTYLRKHGTFVKNDERMVHPNVAILLRNKGIVK